MKNKVSLQINLSPGDFPHVRYLLKHQLEVLSKQVDEVILTIESQPAKGRFGEGWETYQALLDKFIAEEIVHQYDVRIVPVDYSAPAKRAVAEYFFGKSTIPDKDFRGGPFYAYFFGLYTAANDLVFHLDSDMFLGGGSQTWVKEAVQFLNPDDCLTVSPLPGPPHPEDKLTCQAGAEKIAPYTYRFSGMSTRIFMLDKSKFKQHKLILEKPGIRNQVKSMIEGNPNADLPEHLLSSFMLKNNYKRVDFLGTGKGLWSLHPPYRTASFYDGLPKLIARVKSGDMPAAQYGFYDMTDELCDWAEARQKLADNRWYKKLWP